MNDPASRALIVLAEDSADLRSLLAIGLEHVGFDVIQAENGVELVRIVRDVAGRQQPKRELSLIITDVRMPRLDGIAAVRALREYGTVVPVIFISAFNDNRTRHQAIELRSRWIDKPIGLNILRAAVADVLGLR